MLSQKNFDLRNLLRGDTPNIVPNSGSLDLNLDTFPDGRVAGRPAGRAVWWRIDNSASSDQTELGFGWVCLSLATIQYIH